MVEPAPAASTPAGVDAGGWSGPIRQAKLAEDGG
jgi:hypothetical protein